MTKLNMDYEYFCNTTCNMRTKSGCYLTMFDISSCPAYQFVEFVNLTEKKE